MSLKNKKPCHSAGFGITEVLIASGLFAILTLSMMSMITDAFRAQRGARALDAMRDFASEVRSVLSDPTACLNSFTGTNLTSGSISLTSIKDKMNVNKFTTGTEYLGGLLKFDRAVLRDFVPDTANPNIGTANLFLYAGKVGSTIGALSTHHVLSVHIEKGVGQTIIKCLAIGGLNDSLWKISAFNSNDIYYSGGRVGIGVNNPGAHLDVLGNIRSSSNFLGPQDSEFGIYTDSSYAAGAAVQLHGTLSMSPNTLVLQTGAVLAPRVTINATGNVGIGTVNPATKLDVAGDIKISASGALCSAANEGSMRYNSGSKVMEFCNGTVWAAISQTVVLPGTFCGSVSYDHVLGHNFNPRACGSSFPTDTSTLADNCPSGYALYRYFQADSNYGYTCVKL